MDISFGKLRKGFTVEHAAIAALGLNYHDIQGIQREINGINNDADLSIKESDKANSLSEKLEAIKEIIVALQQELDAWRFGDHISCLEFFLKMENSSHEKIYIDYNRSIVTRASLRQWFAENGISTEVFNAPESRKESSHSQNPEQTAETARPENHIKETESKTQSDQPSDESVGFIFTLSDLHYFLNIEDLYDELSTGLHHSIDTLTNENEQLKISSDRTPSYLNPEHACYSLKLAIAITAWEAVAASPPENKITVKTALKQWLRINHLKIGLIHNGQLNNLACEEISKIVNWKPEGGLAKTL